MDTIVQMTAITGKIANEIMEFFSECIHDGGYPVIAIFQGCAKFRNHLNETKCEIVEG